VQLLITPFISAFLIVDIRKTYIWGSDLA